MNQIFAFHSQVIKEKAHLTANDDITLKLTSHVHHLSYSL